MDKYIYINEHSLSSSICIDIMQWYEQRTDKRKGATLGGTNLNIKDTTDINFARCDNPDLYDMLIRELKYNLQKYVKSLRVDDFNNENQNTNDKYIILPGEFTIPTILIQKYEKGVGKYVYHSDFATGCNRVRVITFLWYLNNVDCGGQTVFNGNMAITPTMGKLVLFPATWTYPHCGKMPISSDKYIITGWIYIKDVNE